MSVKSSVLLSVFAAIAVVCIAAFVVPVAPKNSASQGELGPVAMRDLAGVVGGSGEGEDCFTHNTNACSTALSSVNTCQTDDRLIILNAACPTGPKVFTGAVVAMLRSRSPSESHNTLGSHVVPTDCYFEYSYTQEKHTSGLSAFGFACDEEGKCETCDDYESGCMTCELSDPRGPIQVSHAVCSDP